MTCIVQKYGGSSVADIDKLRRIARLIANVRQQGIQVAVVENNITTHVVTTTSFRISLLVPRELVDQSVQICHDGWVRNHFS